jgi:hypothetical protein
MTLTFAGLLLLQIPAGIPAAIVAHAQPSSLVTALALIASLFVALVIVVLGLAAISACVLSARHSAWERAWGLDADTPLQLEPDPIESYPPAESQPSPVSSLATKQLFLVEPGQFTVPLNPIGPSRPNMRIPE